MTNQQAGREALIAAMREMRSRMMDALVPKFGDAKISAPFPSAVVVFRPTMAARISP